ncbi:MAG: FecR domain-containing protein [Pseudomonadota bacterium]
MAVEGLDVAALSAGTPAGSPVHVIDGMSSGGIHIDDAESVLRASFDRQGPDLLIEGRDGSQILIQDYFTAATPPDLILGEGAGVMKGSLVSALAGSPTPGQYAQLDSASLTASSVGQVEAITGEAFAVRVDGTRVALEVGSPIYLGDVLETSSDGAVAVLFADGTQFSLSEDARMVVDELIYDPGSDNNVASFSLVQGLFVLVSGDVAKTGDMTVETPVSTIGIRGTSVAIQAAAEGIQNLVTLLQDPDETTGLVEVATNVAAVILSELGATTSVSSINQAPSPVEILDGADIEALYRAALATMQVLNDADLGVETGADDGSGDQAQPADPDAAVQAFAEAVEDLFEELAAAIEEAEGEGESEDGGEGEEETGASAGDELESLPDKERNDETIEEMTEEGSTNSPPAGEVTLTGASVEDTLLTADASEITDADGLGEFSYQWQVLTEGGWVNIDGATDETFAPGDDQVGAQVRVVVSYTDGGGTSESVASGPTDPIANVNDAPEGDVVIAGDAQEDSLLTADASGISDDDGLGDFSYQWQALVDGVWTDIAGATGTTFTPGDDQVGNAVRVVVSYTDGQGTGESVTSDPTAPIGNLNDPPVGDVLIDGVAQENALLTADTSGLSDADGLGDLSYQWQALVDGVWTDVAGATDDTFTPDDPEVGSQLRVVVSYTDGNGTAESVTSGATDPVTNVNDDPAGAVAILGDVQEDSPLTADTSGLSDADGLGAFSYQWQALVDGVWTDIAGATDQSFTPGDDQVGDQLRVVVSYTDGGGNAESVESDATAPVENVNDEPDGVVTIGGVAQEDSLLTADASGLTDDDGLGAFSYQWQALVDGEWTDIAGATDETFTPGDDQVGDQLRVVVSYTDGEGTAESVESASTDSVANVNDDPAGAVVIEGDAQEDSELTANTDDLTDDDGLGAFSYQWQALVDGEWTDVAGATDDTFAPGDDQVGQQVRVVVSYTDGEGTPESVTSDPTDPVGNINDDPEGDVTIAGLAQEDEVLTADASGISDADGLGAFSYQWQALIDGTWTDIAGATGDTFTPGDDQVGDALRVVVSYTDGGGNPESVASEATDPVANVNDEPAGAVVVDGAAQEDSELSANTDGLSDDDGLGDFSYQWQALVDGEWTDIAGATDDTFTPGDDEVGAQVRVVVSYTDGEGTAETVESAATDPVGNVNDEPEGDVTIDGAAQEDAVLTANTDNLSDDDGLGAFSYQWQALVDGEWVDIAGATEDTFTPGDDQVGQQLRVVVDYTDGEGTAETVESDPTAPIGNENDPPEGAVLVDGVAQEDSELAANTDGLSDDDGLGEFSYQWQALVDGEWVDIAGATDDTFTPGDDEVGAQVRVVVSYTDGEGTPESVESDPTAAVANVNDDPAGVVTIDGAPQEDSELTANTDGLSDDDGLGDFSYQWQALADGEWIDIAGATAETFAPGDDQVGDQLRVVVSYTDGEGTAESVESEPTAPIGNENDPPEGAVLVDGIAQEDAELSANTGGLSDDDGLGEFSYQWQALIDGEWVDIAGATDDTFTPGDDQVGDQLRVVVSYTDGQGTAESVESGATDPVANVNDEPAGAVLIDGVAQEDSELAANTDGLSDDDGLGAFSYQWQALIDGEWIDIAGATDDSFTPGDVEVGAQVRVVVSYTDGEGTAETVESDATDPIANVNDEPAGAVTIDGVAQEDSELTANTDGLSDDDGLGEFSYQWQSLVDGEWIDIAGATDDAFTPGDDQVGQQLRVVVSYTDGEGTAESVESDPTASIGNENDPPEGAVLVDGVAQEDSELAANTDGLSDDDGLGAFSYQWQALVDGEWIDVAGATGDTFTPGDDEVGAQVRVVVSYTDGQGTAETVESVATDPVANVNDDPEGAVTIDGVAQEDSELSTNTDGLSDDDGLGEFSYQWQVLVDGEWIDIAGAIDETFTPGDDEVGSQVRVVVSYTDGEGTAETVESDPTGPIANVNDEPEGAVTIDGVAQEDGELTANTDGLSDDDGLGEFSYQWQAFAGGVWVAIAGATDATFTPGDDQVGLQLRVVVDYTDGQGTTESAESAATDPVDNVNDDPDGAVTIDGVAEEDSELTANTDELSDDDGLGEFSYQWQALVDGEWTDIDGATDDTFTPGDHQVGEQVRVVVSYTDGQGTEESIESAPTDPIANVNDEPEGDVIVDGAAQEDSILTANTDGLSDDDGLGEFEYQWQALIDGEWIDIAGAIGDTFTPGDDEVGAPVRVVVSYTDGEGTNESVESAATDPIANVNDEPDGGVGINGVAEEDSTLTADTSDLSDDDGLGPFSYQWQILTDTGWQDVEGATDDSFTPGDDEVGFQMRVVVSYTDGGGTVETVESAATDNVANVNDAPEGNVGINGDPEEGEALTADTSGLSDDDGLGEFSYQWQVLTGDGWVDIDGATDDTFTPDEDQVGFQVRVVVSYTDGQGTLETVESGATDEIEPEPGEVDVVVNNNGEVFLQGTFVELGIGANGAMGTVGAAPESFEASNEPGLPGLSFYASNAPLADGDNGTGDAFLPGIPVENFTLAFTDSEGSFVGSNQNDDGGTDIPMSVESTSSDDGVASATLTGGVDDKVEISQTVSLGADDTYYTTTVTITNTGDETLTGLRYMRNNDPDHEVDAVGGIGFPTINDVLLNPDGTGGVAAVNALGQFSGQSILLVADQSALNQENGLDDGSIQVRASAYGFENLDPFDSRGFDNPSDPNGSTADIGINLVYVLPDLEPGESITITWVTSTNNPSDGNDYLVAQADQTTVDGGNGDDIVLAAREETSETLIGGNGTDALFAYSTGATGDVLVGGNGSDFLSSGGGADSLTGGLGADIFFYDDEDDGHVIASNTTYSSIASPEADTIVDFQSGLDVIQLLSDAFGDLPEGALVDGVNFSVIADSYDGTNAGTNANHDAGEATFVYSVADGTLHYDGNGADAGYTAVAAMDQPAASDIEIVSST